MSAPEDAARPRGYLFLLAALWCATSGALFVASPWLSPVAKGLVEWVLPGTFPLQVVEPLAPEKIKPPKPLPTRFYQHDRMDLSPMFNGMTLRLQVKSEEGKTADAERKNEFGYSLDLGLSVQVPRAAQAVEEVAPADATVARAFPELAEMLASARVSPFYHGLYQRKIEFTQSRLKAFNLLLSRHNFYDCQTILEMAHPRTGRKLLLVQAEMDVVTDGTDTDRTMEYDATSPHFQPYTSYNWPRHDRSVVHPVAEVRAKEMEKLQEQIKGGGLTDAKRKAAEDRVKQIKDELGALKHRSSLVAAIDPFIVLPIFMVGRPDEGHSPGVGDYAIVVHGDKILPAIVGDAGPNAKIGEASLLICRTIDPMSSGKRRPVSELSVSYLVFPGTAEKPFKRPDLVAWRQRCIDLGNEIGGIAGTVHDWAVPAPAAQPDQGSAQAWLRP